MQFRLVFTRARLASAAALVALPLIPGAASAQSAPDGAPIYKQRCAACHDNPDPSSRAPAKSVLASRAPEQVFEVMAHGAMAPMAAGLRDEDMDAVALYLTGKPPVHAAAGPKDPDAAAACGPSPAPGLKGPRWNGWSPTLDNARFQGDAGLKARDLPRLKVKWAFQFTGGVASQPTVAGGRVYFGAGGGRVYSLDARTGCMHWRAEVKGGVRGAVSVGPLSGPSGGSGRLAVFVGDRTGGVHALDAASGQEVWATKIESNPLAMITGSPALHRGRLYVPMSSAEEISPYVKGYRCCTFRGSVTALDAATGKPIWRTFTIADPPKPYRTGTDGVEILGPAGAAVWSAPTIDPGRGVLYVATGDSYSDAPNTGSDAVQAMDLVTGQLRWSRQIEADDNFLNGCTGAKGQPAACPRKVGPDHDFGASPILVRLPDGKSVLLAGQKSAAVTALDPDRKGDVLWQTRIGEGGPLGGIEWGMATDGWAVFVPIADPYQPKEVAKRGIYGVRITDGRLVWSAPAPAPNCATAPRGSLINICTSGLSAAPTAIPGAVFEGSMDGILRAYAPADGKVVWSFDIGQTQFHPLNGSDPVKGASMNAGSTSVAGGTLFQVSGYQSSNPRANNLLIAFTVDGH
jgi:polyvinyl alcohol dehydrogenase (cytochrome)